MPNASIHSLNLFTEEAHQPFFRKGGSQAALLIHGFMGTPAEMRPLANDLHRAGWTVEGLLLPGFGAKIDTLFERRYVEWIEATRSALNKLRTNHQTVLLIGYSMGGAIALSVSVENPPDGLILLAPFWRIGSRIHYLVWQIIKHIFPNPQPFKRVNFSDPHFSALVSDLLGDIDLTDPEVQEVLRQLRVPAKFVDEMFGVGKTAKRSSSRVDVPTLILQGREDKAVRPAATRQLLQGFSGAVNYQELPVDHDLLHIQQPAYSDLVKSVLGFANNCRANEKFSTV